MQSVSGFFGDPEGANSSGFRASVPKMIDGARSSGDLFPRRGTVRILRTRPGRLQRPPLCAGTRLLDRAILAAVPELRGRMREAGQEPMEVSCELVVCGLPPSAAAQPLQGRCVAGKAVLDHDAVAIGHGP
jgi:hypothetical protein